MWAFFRSDNVQKREFMTTPVDVTEREETPDTKTVASRNVAHLTRTKDRNMPPVSRPASPNNLLMSHDNWR